MGLRAIWLCILATSGVPPVASLAQGVDQVATGPPNLVLGNHDSVPVGPFGGLEGRAYAARVGDPSAAWFNPAGLSRQRTAQISGSAGVYQRISVRPQGLPHRGGSVQQLPNFVGLTFNVRGGLTAGAALLTTTAWVQETDSELILPQPAGQERLAFSADSDFTRSVAAVGLGYVGTGAWRVGGGLTVSMIDLRLVQSVSDRLVEPMRLSTLLVSSRIAGSSTQLRTQVGIQYDASHLRFGIAVRSPGFSILENGTLTLDSTLDAGAASLGASLFDPDARFEYHQPWEFHGGVAYVADRIELEVDVLAYSAIASYSMLSTPNPLLIYSSAGDGTPPSVMSRSFSGLTSVSDGVVNAAIGGHVRVFKNRDFRIHGNFATGQSPVAAGDQVFNKVDLVSWTVGVSGAWAKLQFAAGFNQHVGTSPDVVVRHLLTGEPVRTAFGVHTAGFIYSIAYQF